MSKVDYQNKVLPYSVLGVSKSNSKINRNFNPITTTYRLKDCAFMSVLRSS